MHNFILFVIVIAVFYIFNEIKELKARIEKLEKENAIQTLSSIKDGYYPMPYIFAQEDKTRLVL